MKILQINSICGIGSTGRIVTDNHIMLTGQGHESYIAYGRDLPKNCDDAIKIGTKFDNYAHVAKTRIFDRHGFGSKKATREFIEKVKEIDPDIIHLHLIHGYYINIEILFNYIKETNKPVVWTLHDCWSFTGHCSHFNYIGCDRWKSGCFACPQIQEYPKSLLVDNSKMNYRKKKELLTGINDMTIVTPSKWLAQLVEESFLKEYRIEVINNGIDLASFRPTNNEFGKKFKLENKFVILGVASNWSYRKGFDFFLELASNLQKDEIIVLVGLLKKQLSKIPNNILGISKTKDISELADIYSCADVLVNPTLEDNFPTVNLEALACGTPVVTFDTGGSSETVDNTTGIIVKEKSAEKLYVNISKIKDRGKSSYEKACVNRAIKCYSKSDKYNEYICLYEDILS